MYGSANLWVYYAAVVANFFLRCLWTLSLIPESEGSPFMANLQIYLSPFLAVAEIFRRTMWGMFRLENEHLKLSNNLSDWYTNTGEDDSNNPASGFEPLAANSTEEEEAEAQRYQVTRHKKNLVESAMIVLIMAGIAVAAALGH
jgi:hypothetical protein